MSKLALAGIACVFSSLTIAQTPTITCYKTSATMTVDGNLTEPAWITNTAVTKAIIGTPNNATVYGVTWNNTYLYVGIKVTDANLFNESTNNYDDDAVEVYIDADNNGGTTYGTNDRQFMLQGRQITLHENRLTGPDGTLAGAHLTMIEAVRHAVGLLGISLVDALIMASRTSAAFLGLESELGRIAPGYCADLVAFNPNFEIVGTWVGGVGRMGEASEASHRG